MSSNRTQDHFFSNFRTLQIKLDQPVSDPASPRDISNGDTAANLSSHIQTLRSEVVRLKNLLSIHQQERKRWSFTYVLYFDC